MDGVAIDKPAFVVITNQYINGFEEQTSTTIPHTQISVKTLWNYSKTQRRKKSKKWIAFDPFNYGDKGR